MQHAPHERQFEDPKTRTCHQEVDQESACPATYFWTRPNPAHSDTILYTHPPTQPHTQTHTLTHSLCEHSINPPAHPNHHGALRYRVIYVTVHHLQWWHRPINTSSCLNSLISYGTFNAVTEHSSYHCTVAIIRSSQQSIHVQIECLDEFFQLLVADRLRITSSQRAKCLVWYLFSSVFQICS